MQTGYSHRTLAIAAALIMMTSLWGGMMAAQPTVPPLPINDDEEECIEFNQSPLSLYDIDGVVGPDDDFQVNPGDLDGDGFANEIEFLQRSDPTDERSTPNDRDGDGVDRGVDECDFNPNVPANLKVSLEVNTTAITRGQPFLVNATVEGPDTDGDGASDPVPDDGTTTVTLLIDVADNDPLAADDNNYEIPMVKVAGEPGLYQASYTPTLDDASGDWVLDARAERGDFFATVRSGTATGGDERPVITVDPIHSAPPILLFACRGSDCDEAIDENERDRFFIGEKIQVVVRPDSDLFDISDDAAQTAELTYTITTSDGAVFVSPPVTMDKDNDGPEGAFQWTKIIDPSDPQQNPFDVFEDDTAGFKPSDFEETPNRPELTFDFAVEAEDDADEPNTVLTESSAVFRYVELFIVQVITPDDPVQRGEVLTIRAEYRQANQENDTHSTVDGPDDAVAVLKATTEDAADEIATVTLKDPENDGSYVGTYLVKIDDPIHEDDVFGITPWAVDVLIGGKDTPPEKNATRLDVPHDIVPRDVPGTVGTDQDDYPTVVVTDQNLHSETIAIDVTYTYEDPVHNDAAGSDPGTAEVTIFGPGETEAPITGDGNAPPDDPTMVFGPVPLEYAGGTTFVGTVHVPAVYAVAAGGTWTVHVDYTDDAEIPNEGEADKKVVVHAELGTTFTTIEHAEAGVFSIYGSNIDDVGAFGKTGGLTGDPAVDFTGNVLGPDPEDDEPLSHRFVVIKGAVSNQIVEIGPDGEEQTETRLPKYVGVQFHDQEFFGADIYFLTQPDGDTQPDGTRNWEIIIDAEDYCHFIIFCNSLDDFEGRVDVRTFVYTGEEDLTTSGVLGSGFYLANDPTGTFSPLQTSHFEWLFKGETNIDDVVVAAPKDGGGKIELPPGPSLHTDTDIEFRVKWAHDVDPTLNFAPGQIQMLLVRARYENCHETEADPRGPGPEVRVGNTRVLAKSEWCVQEVYRDAPKDEFGLIVPAPPTVDLDDHYLTMAAFGTASDSCIADDPWSEKLVGCDRWNITIPGPLFQDRSFDAPGNWSSNNERFWIRVQGTNVLGYESDIDTPNLQGADGESGRFRATTPSADDFAPHSGAIPDFDGKQFTYLPHDARFTMIGPLYDWRAPESEPQRTAPTLLKTEDGDAFWEIGENERFYRESGRDILGIVSDEAGHLDMEGSGWINARGTTTKIDAADVLVQVLVSPGQSGFDLEDEEPAPGYSPDQVTVIDEVALTSLSLGEAQEVDPLMVDDDLPNDITWSTTIEDLEEWAKHEMIDWLHETPNPRWAADRQTPLDGRVRLAFEITTDTGIYELGEHFIEIDMNAWPDVQLAGAESLNPIVSFPAEAEDFDHSDGPIIECRDICTLTFLVHDFDGVNATGESDDPHGRHVESLTFGERVRQECDRVCDARRQAAGQPIAYEWLLSPDGVDLIGIAGADVVPEGAVATNEDGEDVWAEFTAVLHTVVPDEDKELPSRNNPFGTDAQFGAGTHHFGARANDGVETFTLDDQMQGYGRFRVGIDVSPGLPSTNQPFLKFRIDVNNDQDGDTWTNSFEIWVHDNLRDGKYRGGQPMYGQVGIPEHALNGLPLPFGSVDVVRPWDGEEFTINSETSTPCDLDGDRIPNDVQCLGILNLEELFHTHPFLPDSFMDDPDDDGIPNFLDRDQTYRFDCEADSDFDGYCDQEELDAGSDPDNPASTPNDKNANGIPDDLEETLLGGVFDADGDGYGNREEIIKGSNPLDACSTPENTHITTSDADGDGYSNNEEIIKGTNPVDPDDPEPRQGPGCS